MTIGFLALLGLPLGIAVLSCGANHLQNPRPETSNDLGISLVMILGAGLIAPFFGLLLAGTLFPLSAGW